MAFTVLTFAQLAHVMAIRPERASAFTPGFLSDVPLQGAVAVTAALHLAVVYVPALNAVLRTDPLTTAELSICVGATVAVFFAVEAEKWLIRNRRLYRHR